MSSDMQRIAGVADRELKWAQTSFGKQEYELTEPGGLVARLRFRGMFGTLAMAESGDGAWTFKRVGFWQQRATVRGEGSDQDLATFRNRTWRNGGTLEFADGRRFQATTNLWSTRFAFETEAGEMLVRFHYGGVFRLSAGVEIATAARALPELPILVIFGWYLCVMLHRDSSAAGAAAAAG